MFNSATTSVEQVPHLSVDSSRYTPSEYTTNPTLASTTVSSSISTPFIPTRILQIQAPGKSPLSFSTGSNDLVIPIFSPVTGRPVYLSIRPKRSSNSCFLVDVEDDTETSIANTTYWFGPGRHPQVKIGRDDDVSADVFKIKGSGLFTRNVNFESRKWGRFEWRYAKKSERGMVAIVGGSESKINNLLVLEKIVRGGGGKEERIKIGQMIRSDETRTPGTKQSDAGNGGKLEMCLKDKNGRELVDELTVVVTALVMLKREIDISSARDIAIISGAVNA